VVSQAGARPGLVPGGPIGNPRKLPSRGALYIRGP
jgi:hypothetical protein